MNNGELVHKLGVLVGALMIIAGVLFGVRLFTQLPASVAPPTFGAGQRDRISELDSAQATVPTPSNTGSLTTTNEVSPVEVQPTARPVPNFVVGYTDTLPRPVSDALADSNTRTIRVSRPDSNADADVVFSFESDGSERGSPVYTQVFAVADRFDAPTPAISWNQVQSTWQGDNRRYRSLAVLEDTLPALESVLGPPEQASIRGYASVTEISTALLDGEPDLAIVPFDLLAPRLTVFDVDDQNPLQSDGSFDLAAYPLVATLYAYSFASGERENELSAFLDTLPKTNRDPDRLTTVAMTGVTAMVRFTAARMDQRGTEWPAEVVGPVLAAADITAISNEVPFVEGCETDLDPDNLVFCSKPEYMDALLAAGTDVVGLTGNHQNDHGPEGALRSLHYYADAGIQVYGGGADKKSAMQPLVVEHNGNRIAFLGANSYGPPEAWASDFLPGSAPFDLNIMSAMIRGLKADGEADVVLAELQYQESYDTMPLPEQQADFRALVRAGADVVTGVQSHVPQAIEFLDDGLILYGLGNLFFDQMWTDETREGLIVLHFVYDGRHISTRLLPTILHDYGQPRWASSVDRARILQRVFDALSLQ